MWPTVNSQEGQLHRLTRCWPRWHSPDGFDDIDEPDHWQIGGMPSGECARLVRTPNHWEIHRLVKGSWLLCPGLYPHSLSALEALEEMVFQSDCGH